MPKVQGITSLVDPFRLSSEAGGKKTGLRGTCSRHPGPLSRVPLDEKVPGSFEGPPWGLLESGPHLGIVVSAVSRFISWVIRCEFWKA